MLWYLIVLSFIASSPALAGIWKQYSNICSKNQWQCRDGLCINFDGKCDGVVDCPDRSDESHALCRENKCQMNWFRCTYGACVDGTAPCNGVQECADNSDELLPHCRNDINRTNEIKVQFRCQDGETISITNLCDGIEDCADGSDETVRSCAGKTCPSYLFQCAYGACVDQGSDCNGIKECADGSDESEDLCGDGQFPPPVTPPENCILPRQPAHGRYMVEGAPNASPGQGFHFAKLVYTCSPGYGINGESTRICVNGTWSSNSYPECVHFCKLKKHPSVEYRCLITGDSIVGSRACNEQEPSGTVVTPECKAPNYYYPGVLNPMRCIEGSWNYVAKCSPGLMKTGTKITIVVTNKVDVQLTDVQYYVPIFDVQPVTTATDDNDNLVDSNSDIDEHDWRMGTSGGVV